MDHHPNASAQHHVGVCSSDEEFLALMIPFLREGITAKDEPDPLAIADARKLDLLRDALGADARQVDFRDSAAWYRGTPANGLAMALDYYATHADPQGPIHTSGEPVWRGRSERQTAEWVRYEALVTELFAGSSMVGMCIYDTRTAPPAVIDAARRTHPSERRRDGVWPSRGYVEPAVFAALESTPLPQPPPDASRLRLTPRLPDVVCRRFVAERARVLGMADREAERFGTAASGATTYAAFQHCDAADVLVWSTRERILCEVRGRPGRLSDPFLGFRPPGAQARSDDGLWETRQICEFVDLRSGSNEAEWRIRIEAALTQAA